MLNEEAVDMTKVVFWFCVELITCDVSVDIVPFWDVLSTWVVWVSVVGTVTTVVFVSAPDVCVTELEVVKLALSVESTVAFVIVSVTVVGTVTTVVLVSAPDVCETELEVVPSVESTVAFVIVLVTVAGTVTTVVLVSVPVVCESELEVVK